VPTIFPILCPTDFPVVLLTGLGSSLCVYDVAIRYDALLVTGGAQLSERPVLGIGTGVTNSKTHGPSALQCLRALLMKQN
jgi:hypothetical protein